MLEVVVLVVVVVVVVVVVAAVVVVVVVLLVVVVLVVVVVVVVAVVVAVLVAGVVEVVDAEHPSALSEVLPVEEKHDSRGTCAGRHMYIGRAICGRGWSREGHACENEAGCCNRVAVGKYNTGGRAPFRTRLVSRQISRE